MMPDNSMEVEHLKVYCFERPKLVLRSMGVVSMRHHGEDGGMTCERNAGQMVNVCLC